MAQYSDTIQSKMSKLENSCSDLRHEVFTALKFLFRLKENISEIIRNLNGLTKPEVFLKEFMGVQSLLLKYQTFLTEVNCKFEMLELSEMKAQKLTLKNKTLTSVKISEIDNRLESFFNCKCKRAPSVQVLTSETSDPIVPSQKKTRRRKRKDKVSESQLENKSLDTTSAADSEKSVTVQKLPDSNFKQKRFDSNYNAKGKAEKNSQSTNVRQKKNSKLNNSSNKICLPDVALDFPNISLHPNGIDAKSSNSVQAMPCSKISPASKLCLDQTKVQPVHSTKNVSDSSCDTNTEPSETSHSNETPEKDLTSTETDLKTETLTEESINQTVNENKKFEIKPPTIIKNVGDEFDVVLEHIKSPSEFYVSINNGPSDLFLELDKKLKSLPEIKNTYYKNTNENRKASFSKEIGDYALFYSKCDELWYRVKVINWYLNLKDNFVSIFLIDSGESKCVSIDDLQPMPESFKNYPARVYKCHLSGIFPLDMSENCETLSWERGSTEKMRSLTEKSKKVSIRIAPDDIYHPSSSLPVTLLLVDRGYQSVNEMLVKTKYAIYKSALEQQLRGTESVNTYVNENNELENWNPMKEDFESYKNTYDLDMSDPGALIYGYVGKDYERLCPHFARTGYCFKGRGCRKEHRMLNPYGFTTDQEEIYKSAFNSLEAPPLNSVIQVQITCLETYNHFYCISDAFNVTFYGDTLETLLQYINKPENVLQMKKLLIPPSPGQIVIARYTEDGSWYRARVLESQPERDLYTVIFVDYGNKDFLSISNLRVAEPKYLHLPFQAVECFIFGIQRNPKVPISEIMCFVNERINDGEVCIEVVARLPGEQITLLVNVFDRDGKNIGHDLLEAKYAIPKEELIADPSSEFLPG